MASPGLQELYKPIGLLDRYLGQLAIFVEDMEHVSLGHSLGGKIACTREVLSQSSGTRNQ